jgi:hypothetical protein
MKRTAIDWLEIVLIPHPISEEDFEHNINCWKLARDKEKQNIIDAYVEASERLEDIIKEAAEDYYNKTFK